MSYRKFTDRDGNVWEVRDTNRSEWQMEPVSGNPLPTCYVKSPGYESDPFELSDSEMQRLLDGEDPARRKRAKSPFGD